MNNSFHFSERLLMKLSVSECKIWIWRFFKLIFICKGKIYSQTICKYSFWMICFNIFSNQCFWKLRSMKIIFDKSSYVWNLSKFFWLFKFIRKSFIACSSLIKRKLIRNRLSGSELFIFLLIFFVKVFVSLRSQKMFKKILLLNFYFWLTQNWSFLYILF